MLKQYLFAEGMQFIVTILESKMYQFKAFFLEEMRFSVKEVFNSL